MNTTTHITLLVLTACLVLALPDYLRAEPTEWQRPNAWISVGFAKIDMRTEGRHTPVRFAVSAAATPSIFGTFSYIGYNKTDLWEWSTTPAETFNELAAMIGVRATARHIGYVSASAGISVDFGRQESWESSSHRWSAVGLPIDVHLVLAPIPYLGVGIGQIADINAEYPFSGTTFEMYFGKIW